MTVAPARRPPTARARRRRVLFCTLAYYPTPAGGAERQARLQAEELVRRGHHVTVVCQRDRKVETTDVAGVHVVRLPNLEVRRLRKLTYLPLLGAYALACGRRFDLIHVHLANVQADVVALAARVIDRPVYTKVACGGSIGEISRMSQIAWLTRRVGLRWATAVQALSEEIANELRLIGVEQARIVRLPNGIDGTRFRPASSSEKAELRQRLGLPDGLLVLFAGRFAAYKGVEEVVSAWRLLRPPGATLVLVGSADTECPVDPIAPAEGLIVRDWTNDIVRYLQAVDVFVSASHGDGMSNSLLEAMSCGLAIVATRVGAAEEMVEDGVSALMFDAGDREALERSLDRLLTDDELRARLGEGAATAAARYDIGRVVDGLEAAYERMVPQPESLEQRRAAPEVGAR